MDTVRPTNHPSIDTCVPSTRLSLGIAASQREPVPSPQTPLVLVQLRKKPENLQIVTRLKFPIVQMYNLYSCTVNLERLLNRESNNRRNTVQQSQNSPNFNTVPRKKQQIREVVRRVHCIYQ